jgi:hypothetical protein
MKHYPPTLTIKTWDMSFSHHSKLCWGCVYEKPYGLIMWGPRLCDISWDTGYVTTRTPREIPCLAMERHERAMGKLPMCNFSSFFLCHIHNPQALEALDKRDSHWRSLTSLRTVEWLDSHDRRSSAITQGWKQPYKVNHYHTSITRSQQPLHKINSHCTISTAINKVNINEQAC